MTFQLPIRTAVALGYDEPRGVTKAPEDIAADLDFIDFSLETYLSAVGQTATSTGAWVAYSSTLTGAGWTQGNGVIDAKRVVSGNITTVVVKFTFGSTTVAGGGNLAFSLPNTPAVILTPLNTYIQDVSASARYGGGGELQSTLAYPMLTGAAGAMSFVVAGTPVMFSTGDVVALMGTYQKA